MATVIFDTLRFAQNLRDKAKLPQEQAEGIARSFAEASGDQLATKADISLLKSDVREVELRLDAKIESTKADILRWMFGSIAVQTIVIIGVLFKFSGKG